METKAPLPILKATYGTPFWDAFSGIFHSMLWMMSIVLICWFLFMISRMIIWLLRKPVKNPKYAMKPVLITPKPLPPQSPVPQNMAELVQRLRKSAEKVKSAADKQTLLTICGTIPRYYQRHREYPSNNDYRATVEEKLRILAGMVDRYIDIQDNPEFYTFDSEADELYLTHKPDIWLKMASQSIEGYLDILQTALRDDNKLVLATFERDIDSLMPVPTSTCTPTNKLAGKVSTLHGKAHTALSSMTQRSVRK